MGLSKAPRAAGSEPLSHFAHRPALPVAEAAETGGRVGGRGGRLARGGIYILFSRHAADFGNRLTLVPALLGPASARPLVLAFLLPPFISRLPLPR
jgi:hypothetical protein